MGVLQKIFKRKAKERREARQAAHQEKDASLLEAGPSGAVAIGTDKRKIILGVISRPHLTEKASVLTKNGTYAFVVRGDANKPSVKRAVEARYGVAVKAVRTVKLPAKMRRRGRQIGWRPGIKKAYVTLREGERIEIE